MNTIGDIFRRNGPGYRSDHLLPLNQLKAMSAIERCRTASLGGHILQCKDCGTKQIYYHSCRNRHCPQCQGETKKQWVEKRQEEMLPVAYYHIIFTVPSELNGVIQQNQKLMYGILFKAAADTLTELSLDRKYLGAKIGFMSVLHTWGQNLMQHPHLHVLIPGGGISGQGDYWLDISHRRYFMPVHVLSQVFRGKFMHLFMQLHLKGRIKYFGEQAYLEKPKQFRQFKQRLFSKGWIVHVRPPFSTASIVIEYLSRYLNRVAISNSRIMSNDSNKVSFRWKDNRDGEEKIMNVTPIEFIRRYLLHVLPDRFVKIRYYGFLSNRNRAINIKKCHRLITFREKSESQITKGDSLGQRSSEPSSTVKPNYIIQCICCNGIMEKRGVIPRSRHGPD